MRTSIIGGLLLVVATPLLVGISAALDLDLELEPVVLTGAALGAAVALVADRTPGARLTGFVAGVLVAAVGYLVRAGYLPDTSSGRAVAAGLTVALCVLVWAATVDRLPLWAVLLGAGGFAGAYEAAFSAAPTEVLSSSISTLTSYGVAVAVGFLVCSVVAPARRRTSDPLDDIRHLDNGNDNYTDLVLGEKA